MEPSIVIACLNFIAFLIAIVSMCNLKREVLRLRRKERERTLLETMKTQTPTWSMPMVPIDSTMPQFGVNPKLVPFDEFRPKDDSKPGLTEKEQELWDSGTEFLKQNPDFTLTKNDAKPNGEAFRKQSPHNSEDEQQSNVDGPPTREQRLAHLPNVEPRCPDGSPDWDTHMRLCGGCEDCDDIRSES